MELEQTEISMQSSEAKIPDEEELRYDINDGLITLYEIRKSTNYSGKKVVDGLRFELS